jgi:hypothetical protein
MPYSKFTLPELRKKFGLQIERIKLFDNISPIEISDWLKETLQISGHISLLSEKAKSELIVTPVLLELLKRNNYQVSLFSGVELNVDEKMGLNGECDFIIVAKPNAYDIESPIISMVEAKDDDISLGIPQCIAQMVAALQYNQSEGKPIDTIFGCVTTGSDWQFLKLCNNTVFINSDLLYINPINNLIGVWQFIIDFYRQN